VPIIPGQHNEQSPQPAQGNYRFVPVVPLAAGQRMHSVVNSPRWISSSQKDPNCSGCLNTSSTRYRTHNGVDIAAGRVTAVSGSIIPIYAMQSGIVTQVTSHHRDNTVGACNASITSSACGGCTSGTGNLVTIRHATSNGNSIQIDGRHVYSRYLHLAPGCVTLGSLRVGQWVNAGQRIGTMGTTGHSTGIHLHWDMMLGARNSDPINKGWPSSGSYVCAASYYP